MTDSTEWHPPQEKLVHTIVMCVLGFAAVVGGAMVIKTFVPTIADALAIIQTLLANTISTVITASVLAVVLWLAYETFSPKGKINGLFSQAYSSFIHNLTVEMLNVDPMSPLKDCLAAAKIKKAEYDESFAKFDGAISTFAENEANMRERARKAEARAKAALAKGDQTAFNNLAYEQGEELKTADDIAAMRQRLVPVRDIIVRMQGYAADLISKLGVDIEQTQIKWDMANQMSAMDKVARGFTKDGAKSQLALEAQAIVTTKYATSIGRLENLSDMAKPLLDSADLDKATYSQDLLAKWQQEDRSTFTPIASVIPQQVLPTTQNSFASLIK